MAEHAGNKDRVKVPLIKTGQGPKDVVAVEEIHICIDRSCRGAGTNPPIYTSQIQIGVHLDLG